MEKIAVAVVNYKGGVGKTTLSIILAQMSLMKRRKVLAVDLDPQMNFKYGLSYDMIQKQFGGFMNVKTSIESADADADADWIILDCPPVIGEAMRSALDFADIALVPVQPDIFSVNNLDELYKLAYKLNLDKNQLPIVKIGYGQTALSRKLDSIIAEKGYPVAGQIPVNRLIPYNIASGRIWATGFSAEMRRPYENLYERVEKAYERMLAGNFDGAWAESDA